jgi:ABC-type lipoprotein export system ATPase subunit
MEAIISSGNLAKIFWLEDVEILADEATGELDTETTHDILHLFRRIVAEEGGDDSAGDA